MFRCYTIAIVIVTLLLAIPAVVQADEGEGRTAVALPKTPAGAQLAAFLTAFNTGNPVTLKAYIESNVERPQNDPGVIGNMVDQDRRLYDQSHGFVVRKITVSSSAVIKVLAQARSTGAWMELTLFVTAQPPDYVQAAPPYHIVGIGFSDTESPLEFLPHQKLTEAQIRAKTDAMMTALVRADAFSGVIYVAKNGKPLYTKAVGLANREWNIPNRIDTEFDLASITKMFTAVAVAQLVEQGKLSYSDTVGKILPDYPNKEVADKVRLYHLLSHTSGLIGGRALVEKTPQSPTLRTINEMLVPFVHESLSFPPGQQFDYSNAGFILLGAIIEKASGQSYYDYVRDHVFKPAGMMHTDFYELDTDPKNIATGFKDGTYGVRFDNIFDLGVKGSPADMAYSTGEDMVRFHMALIHHRLLGEPSLNTLWTGVTEDADRHSEYGFGAQISHYNGARIVGHGGGWQGVTNQFEMYPELGYTVAILSNYDDDPNAIANKLREWLTQGTSKEAGKPAPLPSLTLTANISSSTVAKGRPITIEVTVTNGGGVAHSCVIDMEIKDAQGNKADQQFTMGQRIDAGQVRRYTYSWTPMIAGTYTVDLGGFGPQWTPKYQFEPGVATITVD